jgi:ubiquitin C-terminal hydrolase
MPNSGLMNSTVICYANALCQALASCNHLTILFDDPPQDSSDSFSLNHAFCVIIHSMVKRQPNQQDVVDPSDFLKLFCDRHTDFKFEQSKSSYDICVEAIRLDHDILTISPSPKPIQLPPI